MLSSGMDLKNDPQLADEFEHLLNADQLARDCRRSSRATASRPSSKTLRSISPTDITFAPNPELVAKLDQRAEDHLRPSARHQRPGRRLHRRLLQLEQLPRAHGALPRSALGKYRRHDPERAARRRRSAGPHLPRRRRVRLPAAGAQRALRRRRHVAVHDLHRRRYGLARNGYFDYRFDPEKSPRAYARYMKKPLQPVRRLVPRHGRL